MWPEEGRERRARRARRAAGLGERPQTAGWPVSGGKGRWVRAEWSRFSVIGEDWRAWTGWTGWTGFGVAERSLTGRVCVQVEVCACGHGPWSNSGLAGPKPREEALPLPLPLPLPPTLTLPLHLSSDAFPSSIKRIFTRGPIARGRNHKWI